MSRIFKNIAGQKRAVNILSAHLESGNLSHAYLLIGREGTGKEHLAKEFSRYILCPRNADDQCDSCRKFLAEAHPDFIYVKGDEGIKIEQVREAIERIGLSPLMSEKKVCLVSRAENLGIEAANALLKTLEEPPSDSVIILTTNSEKRLPQTIISRCQTIKLDAVSEKEIFRILGQEFDREEIEKVLYLSEGSIGEARKMLLDKKALGDKKAVLTDVTELLKTPSITERFKIIEEYEKKKNLRTLFEVLGRVVFNALITTNTEEKNILAAAMPGEVSTARQVEMGRKILNIYRNLNYNVSLRISLEEMMIKDVLSV